MSKIRRESFTEDVHCMQKSGTHVTRENGWTSFGFENRLNGQMAKSKWPAIRANDGTRSQCLTLAINAEETDMKEVI